jgi:hypothetical protein
LQSYKLTKPSKLSRSNTPIYLYKKNNSSSNFLKLNDDDGSSSNYKNKLFNWSEYNFKLQQLLNSSSILFDNDNYNYYYENENNDNDNYNDNYNNDDNDNHNNHNNKIINVNFDNDDYNLQSQPSLYNLSSIIFQILIINIINGYLIALIIKSALRL